MFGSKVIPVFITIGASVDFLNEVVGVEERVKRFIGPERCQPIPHRPRIPLPLSGVKVFLYEDLASLKAHVLAFVTAYNFAKHLKALRWKTTFQTICQAWTNDPDRFRINPHHLSLGSYT